MTIVKHAFDTALRVLFLLAITFSIELCRKFKIPTWTILAYKFMKIIHYILHREYYIPVKFDEFI